MARIQVAGIGVNTYFSPVFSRNLAKEILFKINSRIKSGVIECTVFA